MREQSVERTRRGRGGPDDLRAVLFGACDPRSTGALPGAAAIVSAEGIRTPPPITWFRVKAFQDVSLRLAVTNLASTWGTAGDDVQHVQRVYLPCEVTGHSFLYSEQHLTGACVSCPTPQGRVP